MAIKDIIILLLGIVALIYAAIAVLYWIEGKAWFSFMFVCYSLACFAIWKAGE